MARLLKLLEPPAPAYRDRRFKGSQEEFDHRLATSTTIYVGNLSFYTTEEQIHELFSKTGPVKRIIMGLDKNKKTPCGFCFVVYYTRQATEDCVTFVSGTKLDDRRVRCDFDWGFQDDRQFGRGRSGGQVRDEYRTDFDAGRGGFGNIVKTELMTRQQELQQRMDEYAEGQDDMEAEYAADMDQDAGPQYVGGSDDDAA
ncbi:hypothetical protein WJX84_005567 [Apatococcus fuscideae]|uniref:Nuclear cap-binding protein subunit 2 n=1 Tax=Apatococcus fuscideae TaxID=2026836 RepID=A0AAW1TAR0_9CHLO